MKSTTIIALLLAWGMSLLLAATAPAADMKELQQRFKERYPKLQEFKQAGTVGETSDGYIEFVKERDRDAAKVVDAENADRRELYKLLAKEAGTSAEVVAKRNAQRNFERARAGEWLRKDGKWEQKK